MYIPEIISRKKISSKDTNDFISSNHSHYLPERNFSALEQLLNKCPKTVCS